MNAQMIRAMIARNRMKEMMTMKHVIVFYVLMYFVRPGFFLHLPNRAIKQPKKAAIRNGNGRMPMSLIVNKTHAVPSGLTLYPPGQPVTQTPSCTNNPSTHFLQISGFSESQRRQVDGSAQLTQVSMLLIESVKRAEPGGHSAMHRPLKRILRPREPSHDRQ